MDFKKIALATLVGTVTMFFAGWLIWGFALFGIQSSHTQEYAGLMPEMPNMVFMVLNTITFALLYTIIFVRWAGIKTFVTGAKAGAFLAVLIGLGQGFMMLASFNLIDTTVLLTDVLGNLVWGAISGGVIGLVLGKLSD